MLGEDRGPAVAVAADEDGHDIVVFVDCLGRLDKEIAVGSSLEVLKHETGVECILVGAACHLKLPVVAAALVSERHTDVAEPVAEVFAAVAAHLASREIVQPSYQEAEARLCEGIQATVQP